MVTADGVLREQQPPPQTVDDRSDAEHRTLQRIRSLFPELKVSQAGEIWTATGMCVLCAKPRTFHHDEIDGLLDVLRTTYKGVGQC